MTSVNYREVKRKAAVGERIKVIAIHPLSKKNGSVRIGEELTAASVDLNGAVWSVNEREFGGIIYADWNGLREYVVLEPVTTAGFAESPAPASPLSLDPLYAAFRQFIVANADAIRAILPELDGSAITADAITVGTTYPRSIPLSRAQVIAKATADVAELLRIGTDVESELPEPVEFQGVFFSVKFHVNREKRSVTVLVFRGCGIIPGRVPESKFTAKCSPADVFHAEIGKAIALRKALGLTVPTEYTDAPQPEKAEIGAKVYSATRWGTFTIADGTSIAAQEMSAVCYAGLEYCDTHGAPRILDDTDVDYSAVKAKEAA